MIVYYNGAFIPKDEVCISPDDRGFLFADGGSAVVVTTSMAVLIAVYVVLVGLLMVSNLPTYSGKNIGKRISRQWVLPLMIAAVLFVALLFSFPWSVLSLLAVGYLVTLPFSIRAWNRKMTEDRAAG